MGHTTVTWSLLGATVLTCVGSSMLCGYNIAILNLPAENVKNFLTGDNPDDSLRSFYYSIASAVYVIGGAFGAFSSGVVADYLGRRNGLLFNNVFVIVGAVLAGICQVAGVPALLYISRVFIGFNNGMTFGLASMYLTEISPLQIRGCIGACHQLAITSGILLGNIVTLDQLLNTRTLWPLACALTGVPAVLQLCLLWLFPESPRHLLMRQSKELEATRAHERFDPDLPVNKFLQNVREELEEAAKMPPFKFLDIFTNSQYRKPMLIACSIQIIQQLSGINAVMAYSKLMLDSAGVEVTQQPYYVCGISLCNVVSTIISLPLLEKCGRRRLLLWPTFMLLLSLVALCASTNIARDYPSAKQASSVVATIFIHIYVAAFAAGLGVVPALIVSEIFRQGPRAAAYSVSQSVQWVSNLMVMFAYPNLERIIHGYIFLVFLVIVAVIWTLLFFIVPETKGLTFNEVAQILHAGATVFSSRSKAHRLQEAADNNYNDPVDWVKRQCEFNSKSTVVSEC